MKLSSLVTWVEGEGYSSKGASQELCELAVLS